MKKKHTGLDLIGIIIAYVSFPIILLVRGLMGGIFPDQGMVNFQFWPNFLIRGIWGNLAFIALIIVFLYHVNVIKNHVFPGIFAFFINPIAGIFILVGNSKKTEVVDSPLESKLHELETLYNNGLITKDEFETKRKRILDQYL